MVQEESLKLNKTKCNLVCLSVRGVEEVNVEAESMHTVKTTHLLTHSFAHNKCSSLSCSRLYFYNSTYVKLNIRQKIRNLNS